MTTLRLRYVCQDVDRHGNVRTYIRLPRRPKVRVHAAPGTAEFAAAYSAALADLPKPPPAGSFLALCRAYYASPVFAALDQSTRKWRARALDRVADEHGDKPVALLQAKHIRALRNELEATPVVANERLQSLKALFKWAVDHGKADRNPALEIGRLPARSPGWHTWTIEEVEQFESTHPIGTKARLAMALLLYTACRHGDVIRLGPANLVDGRVRFVQAKNEHRNPVAIDIPLHPDLANVLAGTETGAETFLVTQYGRPFSHGGFGFWFRTCCQEAGVPGRAHGLRKALATRLADGGATAHQIQAWTGHTTLKEVERYTRAAARGKAADAGLAKLVRSGPAR